VVDGFAVWDPRLTGTYSVGAYAYFTFNPIGSNYILTGPGGGSYGAVNSVINTIESGQAIVLQHAGAATVTMNENTKTTGSNSGRFRPLGDDLPGHVSTTLHYLGADSTEGVADGVMAMFDGSFSNGVDIGDFKKLKNISENFGILNQGELLAVDKRHTVTTTDTIQYKLSNMKGRKYRFSIAVGNMENPALTAFLEDNYLQTKTELAMNGSTNYDFSITQDSGAWNPQRFKIVFRDLPFAFISIAASQQSGDVSLEWKVTNEQNIQRYEVESSINGINFSRIADKNAGGGGSVSNISYNLLDESPFNGDNYYRIKSISRSGEIKYSDVVKLGYVMGKPSITIYPNPVKKGIINLKMTNLPKGEYLARIVNHLGQTISLQKIQHLRVTAVERIVSKQYMVPGNYHIELLHPDKTVSTLSFINQ
jgi:hypothetical protein